MKALNAPCDPAPGDRHGLVIIVAQAQSFGTGQRYRVRCDCGSERIMLGITLRRWPPKTHRHCSAQPVLESE